MSSESLTPQPPTSGGSAKYIVLILLLLAGGLGVYFATSGEDPKPTPPPAVKTAERNTSLSNDTVQIPVDEEEEEEDAGEAATEEPNPVKRPRPTGDVWTCSGDISLPVIQRVISQAQSSVRGCYERALRNDNQLQGKLALDVRVTPDGKVSHTRVHGTLRDPEVSKCVQALAKQWTFPADSKATCTVFTAPFNLTPKN